MRHWSDAAVLEPAAGAPPHLQMITYWARTIATAHMGNVKATHQNAQKYDDAEQATRKTRYAYLWSGPIFCRGRCMPGWHLPKRRTKKRYQSCAILPTRTPTNR